MLQKIKRKAEKRIWTYCMYVVPINSTGSAQLQIVLLKVWTFWFTGCYKLI